MIFNVLPFVVLAALIFWTISFGKRRAARAVAVGRPGALEPGSVQPGSVG